MTRPTGTWSPTFWLPTTQAYTGSTELRWSWSEFLWKLSLSRWWWDELDEKVEHFETLSLLVRYSTMPLSWHGLACSSTRLLWRPRNILGGKKITFLGRPHSLGRIYLQRRKCIRSSVFITIFLYHSFEYLENMMKRTSGWGRLQSYMIAELQPLYDRLGFEASHRRHLVIFENLWKQERPDEPFLDEKLRIKMLAALCRLGHNECSQSSSNLLEVQFLLPRNGPSKWENMETNVVLILFG